MDLSYGWLRPRLRMTWQLAVALVLVTFHRPQVMPKAAPPSGYAFLLRQFRLVWH